MSPVQACRTILDDEPTGFFTDIEQVHLVLTTRSKGETTVSEVGATGTVPLDSTLVWVVEVHARAVNWDHSVPPGVTVHPATDYSIVMDARTGRVTDSGEDDSWPLPLAKAGTVISLPADC